MHSGVEFCTLALVRRPKPSFARRPCLDVVTSVEDF
jgi:hypothetical protein